MTRSNYKRMFENIHAYVSQGNDKVPTYILFIFFAQPWAIVLYDVHTLLYEYLYL